MVNEPMITAAQVRAARGWLHWTQDDLSRRSGVSQRSIARFELELTRPYNSTLEQLRKVFEVEGLRFEFDGITGTGIRMG